MTTTDLTDNTDKCHTESTESTERFLSDDKLRLIRSILKASF